MTQVARFSFWMIWMGVSGVSFPIHASILDDIEAAAINLENAGATIHRSDADKPSSWQVNLRGVSSNYKMTDLATLSSVLTMLEMDSLSSQDANTVAKLEKLKVLFISADIDDDTAKNLGKSSAISYLRLNGKNLTEVGFNGICNLRQLDTLIIVQMDLRKGSLERLSQLQSLRVLFLDKGDFDKHEVRFVSEIKNLEALSLAGSNVGDADLRALASRRATLTYLNLAETDVSDELVPMLSRLTSLKTLGLTKTKLTEDGIRDLKQSLKGVNLTTDFE